MNDKNPAALAQPTPPEREPVTERHLSTDEIDTHLDAILKAAGSALKHYTLHKPKDDMRTAVKLLLLAHDARRTEPARQPVAGGELPDLWYTLDSFLSALESLKASTPMNVSSIWDDKYESLVADIERAQAALTDRASRQAEVGEPSTDIRKALPDFIRREVERAIDAAVNPKGMSVHDGMARIGADKLQYLLAVIDRAASLQPPAEAASEAWQPIATAPTERGKYVLMWSPKYHLPKIGRWHDYNVHNQPKFTHWMPLPAAPATQQERGPV